MRHPGFGTIGNPPDRDPVRPTSDTRPSTLPRLDLSLLERALHGTYTRRPWEQCNNRDAHRVEAETIAAEYSRLLEERPKVAPESESEKREAFGK